ncbi:MAG: hypothetical protein ACETWO_05745 [Candidatus Hadarchaeaceae archaeon]|nr:hypothetical protein [Hadesarchaea archaeon]
MEQLSVGEDLFATLAVVGLFVLFITALAHSYQLFTERRKAYESFDLTLDIAEDIKNCVLADSSGLIDLTTDKLENHSKLLAREGIELRVEVRTLGGEVLLAHGPEQNQLGGYFSPPCSISLPVAVTRGQGSAQLCELVVWVGGR